MAARTPAPQARDKLAFLLSFVPYLMDIERVSVADAAAHFGVPAEQIRQSVRLIAVSGVPGETTSYQHEDLFDIAWHSRSTTRSRSRTRSPSTTRPASRRARPLR
jgi:proteasome accessory factor C